MIEPAASAMDFDGVRDQRVGPAEDPASSLTIASTTLTESPRMVARTLRWRRVDFTVCGGDGRTDGHGAVCRVLLIQRAGGRASAVLCQERHDRFCACNRFSAWSKMVSGSRQHIRGNFFADVRWEQCMTSAPGLACFNTDALT